VSGRCEHDDCCAPQGASAHRKMGTELKELIEHTLKGIASLLGRGSTQMQEYCNRYALTFEKMVSR
jgi:hypothetical protein